MGRLRLLPPAGSCFGGRYAAYVVCVYPRYYRFQRPVAPPISLALGRRPSGAAPYSSKNFFRSIFYFAVIAAIAAATLIKEGFLSVTAKRLENLSQ
ncbi:MAG: hypothetical protein [Cressdnaviricota sp.]|nr:MAG: hypothetical protein [Cressdnaviricota sp.]